MGIDLSKLTPAPWEARKMACQEDRHTYSHEIVTSDKYTYGLMRPDDAAFIALARNAFDVMMRRKWCARFAEDGSGWFCDAFDDEARASGEFMDWVFSQCYPDPFTALVEADEWYKARGMPN